ncbi:MAG TPA: HAMP domain-containing histidine kinase [Thermosynechococcus sp. M3746_W2019_013]|uniref:sensor histidine kinase n=1 Tax=Thermosynechococcus sp. M3746_W2019_013 TaxID=2747806 RepID=UPI001A0DCEDD|nr:HAMP domain-containing sensor histidine kinase [Thermosynechococcus sp. M3746_W2019_013]HIK23917.1 HAMP domain-containing histidine kinase [Thermosynechococcus sp. M3746_W2019_013]
MVLAIGLIRTSNRKLSQLRNRLFLVYFLLINGILSISSLTIYSLIVAQRFNQLNTNLREVGNWSANIFSILQHEYEELKKRPEYKAYAPRNELGVLQPITVSQLMGKYYFSSVYEVIESPRINLSQGIQWYDKDRNLILYEGKRFGKINFPDDLPASGTIIEANQYQRFLLPVHATPIQPGQQSQILGYVCVIQSTAELEEEINYLRHVFLLNILCISTLTLLAASWLTRKNLEPIVVSLNQIKQFTADASHQLRHPLTAIQASISLLEIYLNNLDSPHLNKVKVISLACQQMSALINKLLMLARMDNNILDQSQWVEIDLDELLDSLIELNRDRAERKGIHLTYQCETNTYVRGHPQQIYEIFSNLLDNALQYTSDRGAITVCLRNQGAFAIVEIQDTGIGIAPQDLPHIFDRFWRSEEARLHYAQGSGLGLTVVKTLVDHYGGTVSVYSQQHQGTTFVIKLPAA